jgi:hypothetical protein
MKHGFNHNYLLHAVMQHHWGSEWIDLNESQRERVLDDFMTDPDMTAAQYKANIWEGNLASYVKCLEV